MDKIDPKNPSIKITFLEINPPINELIKNREEINIIFQGQDNFYDFKKYLSSKIPIQLIRYKKSLIMTLLKSNNIFATGLFTIRPGEQNVIFNYENKKKITTTKTVNINNLLECIKIKILCEFDNKDKDKDISNNININSNLSENSKNNSLKKYVPKVNLMKPNTSNNLKNKNNQIGKKLYEKKKKNLVNNSSNNNYHKKSFVSSSQEFPLGGEYNPYLTEDINNNLKQSSNFNLNDIKKINPYFSLKVYNNVARKTEVEINSKIKGQINKAKSKNYFSTIKRQNKQNYINHIKMNNSSLNLINQKNNLISIDKNEYYNININSNSITNRIIKPTTSFNKNNKRNNINKTNILNSNKNLLNSIDNFISEQIVEHFDKSKKENVPDKNKTNSEKKNFVGVNKNINNIGVNLGFNINENKKRKFNNNNITMNSISTAGTKKNELEFSINSLFDGKDYDEKNNWNKNNAISFSNRLSNEKLQNKLNGNNNINININKHKFNKSLCQQSFIDKIFNENDLSINLNKNEKNNNSNICKSDKIKDDNKKFISLNISENIDKNNDKEKNYINKENTINNKSEIKEFEEEENLEMDSYLLLKEDFNLLYNDDYIKQINDDLLKLEFELFFEKTTEIFSSYHLLMDEKILENQIIKRDYKQKIGNYLLYIKLNNKLQFIKAQQQAIKYNLKDKGINLDKQNLENININENELNIFKLIFPNEKENKSKKLKQIISIIIKEKENKELLEDKIKMFLK